MDKKTYEGDICQAVDQLLAQSTPSKGTDRMSAPVILVQCTPVLMAGASRGSGYACLASLLAGFVLAVVLIVGAWWIR